MEMMLKRIKDGEIPHYSEIEALGFDKAQACLAELRKLHKNNELATPWKMKSTTKLSSFFDKYLIARTSGGTVYVGASAVEYRKTHNRRSTKQEIMDHLFDDDVKTPVPVVQEKWVEEDRSIITFNKKQSYEQLKSYLKRLIDYLDPEREFEIELKIKELENENKLSSMEL